MSCHLFKCEVSHNLTLYPPPPRSSLCLVDYLCRVVALHDFSRELRLHIATGQVKSSHLSLRSLIIVCTLLKLTDHISK